MKKTRRRRNTTTIATWSLQGRLREKYRQEELLADMKERDVGFAALQETLWSQDATAKGEDGEEIVTLNTHIRECTVTSYDARGRGRNRDNPP